MSWGKRRSTLRSRNCTRGLRAKARPGHEAKNMSDIRVLNAAPERLARLFTVAQEVTAASPPTKAPQVEGYRITRILGQGGQAIVYLATQQSTGREVALKIL